METTSTLRSVLSIFFFSLPLFLNSCSGDEPEPEPAVDDSKLTEFTYDRVIVGFSLLDYTKFSGVSFQRKTADDYEYIKSYTMIDNGNSTVKLKTDSFVDPDDGIVGNGMYSTHYVTDSDVVFEIVEKGDTIIAKPSSIAITIVSHQKARVMTAEELAEYAVEINRMGKLFENYKYYPN